MTDQTEPQPRGPVNEAHGGGDVGVDCRDAPPAAAHAPTHDARLHVGGALAARTYQRPSAVALAGVLPCKGATCTKVTAVKCSDSRSIGAAEVSR